MQEEIWAICKLHGFLGIPTLENQLKALDMEYHQLKEQGHSEKADYIQTLFSWLSKKARMVQFLFKLNALAVIFDSAPSDLCMKYLWF